ncbi:hypothetical protein [Ramlibacter sp.]|uniref:hypothetical protein n=1 Tax=Ramlibacter sp. TaxID=1917967 RepID=UPI002D7EFDE1|nr:hypothetical protein [Ramlibacter sp.]
MKANALPKLLAAFVQIVGHCVHALLNHPLFRQAAGLECDLYDLSASERKKDLELPAIAFVKRVHVGSAMLVACHHANLDAIEARDSGLLPSPWHTPDDNLSS